jgi:hypothetical protein
MLHGEASVNDELKSEAPRKHRSRDRREDRPRPKSRQQKGKFTLMAGLWGAHSNQRLLLRRHHGPGSQGHGNTF